MGFVAVLLTRYRITVFPTVAFLIFTAYRIKRVQGSFTIDACSPLAIAFGLILMLYGRTLPDVTWSFTFWIGKSGVKDNTVMCVLHASSVPSFFHPSNIIKTGEVLVATMFTFNSLPSQDSSAMFLMIAAVMSALTLWLRGDLWKYLTLVALQVILAVVLALIFPIMEMLLEAILNEKLRKVGEKVRAQNARMEAYYNAKQ